MTGDRVLLSVRELNILNFKQIYKYIFIDIIQGHRETAINPSSLCISNPVFVREFPLSVDEDRDVTLEQWVCALHSAMTGSTSRQSPQFNPSSLGNVGGLWQALRSNYMVSLLSLVLAIVESA